MGVSDAGSVRGVPRVRVEVLYFEGCPHWQTTADRLIALQAEMDFELRRQPVATLEAAELLGFTGSATIRVNGVDPFGPDDAPIGFACRIYETPAGPAGSPTIEQLRKVLSG
jgi:hypothetical protein